MHRIIPTLSWSFRKISRIYLDKPPHNHRSRRETHIKSNAVRHVIVFIDISFKEKWGTSVLIIEGYKYSLHIILDSSTTTARPEDQEG